MEVPIQPEVNKSTWQGFETSECGDIVSITFTSSLDALSFLEHVESEHLD
jgi:hypothetical protein